MMDVVGGNVILKPITRELCHEIYRKYVADSMMTENPYEYSKDKVDNYFDQRTKDPKRKIFAIVVDGKAIGEAQIKYIDEIMKTGNLAIHLVNDSVKGKGYGSEAEQLIIKYAFEYIGLNTLYGDAVLRNIRSQYVMEKLGFNYVCEDEGFKCYELKREDWLLTSM